MRISAFNLAAACLGAALLTACGGSSGLGSGVPSDRLGATRSSADSVFLAPRHVTGSMVFNYTGAQQNFVVPTGVRRVKIKASGASGAGYSSPPGGSGGLVEARIEVTPGESLAIFVGGDGAIGNYSNGGAGGFNGGGTGSGAYGSGGGGASDVRRGGNGLSDRVVVAGGGGGAGGDCLIDDCYGGPGGNRIGGNGGGAASEAGGGGFGGKQHSGGSGGHGAGYGGPGSPGALGNGGNGGQYDIAGGAGGGGGGYYGGGGGGSGGGNSGYGGGGGGGGSSYVETNATHVRLTRAGGAIGNGAVIISW